MSNFLGSVFGFLGDVAGAIFYVVATMVALLIGMVVILITSAIRSAIFGTIVGSIIFLISTALGGEFTVDRWLDIFQVVFFVLLVLNFIVGVVKWRESYHREQRLKDLGWRR